MITESWESNEQWAGEHESTNALIYYAIRLGQHAAFLIEGAREGTTHPTILMDFEKVSKDFELWLRRSQNWHETHDVDAVWRAGGSLVHNAIGLNSQMKNALDSISQCSISPAELDALLRTLQWWDTGLRRFLRRLAPDPD